MISSENNLGMYKGGFIEPIPVFLYVVKDGNLKFFKHFTTSGSYYIFQKGNGTFFRPREEKTVKEDFFIKDMTDYLSDCPALSEMISREVYGRDDIIKIVELYNENCRK